MMSLLNKIIESALTNIDHDFYSFHRFGTANNLLLNEESKKNQSDQLNIEHPQNFTPESHDSLICNYPVEWTTQYLENSYSLVDPVVYKSKNQFNPFIWGEGYFSPEDIDLEEKEQFIKDANDYNLSQGISVPLGTYNNSYGVMTIAFKKSKFISNTTFFGITSHLNHLGKMISKLQDFSEGKITLSLEEQETLFKFLTNSNHSCTAMI